MARLLPFLVVAAGYWLYRGKVLGGQSAGSAWWGGTPYTNFLMMFEVYARYIRLMAFPFALSPLHTVPVPGGIWDGRVLWGAALLLGSLLVTAWALRKHPWIGLLAAWFLIGLIPLANLIPIPGVMIMAERWLYLPSVGLCILGGWGAWILLLRSRGVMKGVGVGFGVVVLVLFGVRSFSWCPVWKTEENIARILVAKAPGSAVGYNNLGNALLARGRTEEALGYFRQALVLKPDYAEAKSNLAMALMEVGRTEEAHQQVREAVELKPRLASAHNNLGVILGRKGEALSSQEEFREALRLDPNYVEAHYNLGLAYDETGDLPGAAREYREAIGLNSRQAQSHAALGTVLIRQGKLSEGESEFHTSLRLDPNLAEGHTGLGNVFERQRDFVAAEMEFRTALRLKANYPYAYYNLGNCLLSQGRPADAEPCFREAIRLKSTFAYAYYNLALALEDQGQSGEAAKAYKAYLVADPKALDRPEVEKKIARLSLLSR